MSENHHEHRACCGHSDSHNHSQDHPHDHGHADGDVEWTRRLFLFLELLVLLLLGTAMVWFYASGRIDLYLVGWFRQLALIGGLGVMVLGIFNWLMRASNSGCTHDHHDEDAPDDGASVHIHGPDCQHDHDHDSAHSHSHEGSAGGRAISLLLLSGSMTAAAVLTPDQYSNQYNLAREQSNRSSAGGPGKQAISPVIKAEAAQQGGLTLQLIEKYQPRNKEGNFELGVMQLYYSGSDPEYAKIMVGEGVETVGQMVKDEINPGPGRARVFILQMTCCAADARPYSLPVEMSDPAMNYTEMGWYKIAGKVDYIQERGVKTAVLKAKSITATVRPREQRNF